MKRIVSLLLVLCLLVPAAVMADEGAAAAAPQDNLVETKHTATISGKQIDYTATAGTVVMDTKLGQYEIFFTAFSAFLTDFSAFVAAVSITSAGLFSSGGADSFPSSETGRIPILSASARRRVSL